MILIPLLKYVQLHDHMIFKEDDVNFEVFVFEHYCCWCSNAYLYTKLLINFVFPCIIILITNTIILMKLFPKCKKETAAPNRPISRHNSANYKPQNITITLLWVSISFLILVSPYVIWHAWYGNTKDDLSLEGMSKRKFWLSFCLSCLYLNISINFLLYCLSAKPFRDVFLIIIRFKRSAAQ